jgi:RNA polymerase sigma-70 factor (ECF subfamily)
VVLRFYHTGRPFLLLLAAQDVDVFVTSRLVAPGAGMLRITRLPGATETAHLRAEGRITAAEAPELERACRRPSGQGLVLDLARVTFADPASVELLRGIVREGASVVGCTPLLRELLQSDEREPPAPEDAGLVRRLRTGDGAAFETLVRTHSTRLLAVARRMMGGNEADARDVVQEAFLQAHRAIGGFNGTARASTWLHRIVVNAALMNLRSRRRRRDEAIDELLPRFGDEGHRVDPSARWTPACEELVERAETRVLVRRRLIDRLPASYRTVLVMRDIEDLDTDGVASALGITTDTLKVRLHRARQALKTLVERELGAGLDGAVAVAS